ncbi:MAG TPA: cyclodeaminase/cyclohydrolase family protein [Caldilineaceae bacterium]|nr:cyclodeaminase/cyclohydrolase family protein [Caldilineaceae bacterium]
MSTVAQAQASSTTASLTIEYFLDALAARQSMPGGGAAAAVTGAQAAGLVSMVVNFTLGNPKYVAVEEQMRTYLQASEALRQQIIKLADEDVTAFNRVAAGYALPRSTETEKALRTAAIQEALKGATEVPLALAEQCLALLRLVEPVAAKGNVNVVSDAATALYLADAALRSALVNVNINLKTLKDADYVAAATVRRDGLLSAATTAYARAKAACTETLGVTL